MEQMLEREKCEQDECKNEIKEKETFINSCQISEWRKRQDKYDPDAEYLAASS